MSSLTPNTRFWWEQIKFSLITLKELLMSGNGTLNRVKSLRNISKFTEIRQNAAEA